MLPLNAGAAGYVDGDSVNVDSSDPVLVVVGTSQLSDAVARLVDLVSGPYPDKRAVEVAPV